MPFRLSNAPVAFQRFINEVLRDLMDICTVGYLDNILVYLNSLEDHRDHVHEVLHCLCTAGLYANLKKCKFHMDTVEYLRFILSPKGLQMDPAKVSMTQDRPKPQKVRDVQGFLSFANFYQRFMHDYSETTLPLNHLLSQLAMGCVTCHTCHSCVTDSRPIVGNSMEVTHMTSPGHVYIFPH